MEISPKQGSTITPVVVPSSFFQEGNAEINAAAVSEGQEGFSVKRVFSICDLLDLTILPEKQTCEPGETVKVRFVLKNAKQVPCPGNLTVSIVDEGILAKSGQEPVQKELTTWKERLMENTLLPTVIKNAQKSASLEFFPSRYEVRQIVKLNNSSQMQNLDRRLAENYCRILVGLLISVVLGTMVAFMYRYPYASLLLMSEAVLLLMCIGNPGFLCACIFFIFMTLIIYPWIQETPFACLEGFVISALFFAISVPGLLRDRISGNGNGTDVSASMSSSPSFSLCMSGDLPSIPPLASQRRQHFPETLLFLPELVVHSRGEAELDVHFADNITSWNIAAIGNAETGGITAASTSIRARKALFLEQDLPVALVCGDEPEIAWRVYNYSGKPQECTLDIEPADWFTMEKNQFRFSVASETFRRVSTRIKVLQAGVFRLKAGVSSGSFTDILEWKIKVTPAGREIASSQSGRLSGMEKIVLSGRILENAFGATSYVKIYPSPVAEITDSLEAMLKAPYG